MVNSDDSLDVLRIRFILQARFADDPEQAMTKFQRTEVADVGDKVQRNTINEKNEEGFTPLMVFVARRELGQVELLLQMGADTEVLNPEGMTVLGDAVEHGEIEMALLLYKYGANPHARDDYDGTPFIMAQAKGCTDLLDVFSRDDNSQSPPGPVGG